MLDMDLKTFLILLAFGLFGMWFFTDPRGAKNQKRGKRIFKNHGKRLENKKR